MFSIFFSTSLCVRVGELPSKVWRSSCPLWLQLGVGRINGKQIQHPAHIFIPHSNGLPAVVRKCDGSLKDSWNSLCSSISDDTKHTEKMRKKGIDWHDSIVIRYLPCIDAWPSFLFLWYSVPWHGVRRVSERWCSCFTINFYLPLRGVNRKITTVSVWTMLPENFQGLGLLSNTKLCGRCIYNQEGLLSSVQLGQFMCTWCFPDWIGFVLQCFLSYF